MELRWAIAQLEYLRPKLEKTNAKLENMMGKLEKSCSKLESESNEGCHQQKRILATAKISKVGFYL